MYTTVIRQIDTELYQNTCQNNYPIMLLVITEYFCMFCWILLCGKSRGMLSTSPPRNSRFSSSASSVVLTAHRYRFSRMWSWLKSTAHSMSGLIGLVASGAVTMGYSWQRYFQVRMRRKTRRGRRARTMNWKQWYQMQQMQGAILCLSYLRFYSSSESKYQSTYLQAKEPLNQIAVFIVLQIITTHTPTHAERKTSTNNSPPKLSMQRCENTSRASMKPRQKLSLKMVYLDYSFSLLSCSLMSLSSLSTLRAMLILSPSSSSQYISLRVLLYQLPNLRTAGVAVMMKKKLRMKTKASRERWVMKVSSRLKMISRCLRQSWMTALMCWSNTPSTWSKLTTSRQKKRLRPTANQKHCFLLQFVRKNVSIPSFSTQIRMMHKVQNDSRAYCLQNSPTTSRTPTNTTRLALVISTLDSQLENGYYFTF